MPPQPEKRIQGLLTELLFAQKWANQAAECLLSEFAGHFVDVRHYVLCHLRYCSEQVGKAHWGTKDVGANKRRKQTWPFADLMNSRTLGPEDIFSRVASLLREAAEPKQKVGEPVAAPESLGEDPAEEDDGSKVLAPIGRPVGFFLREYRRLFQDAWLKLLSLPAPPKEVAQVLQFLPSRVMPHLGEPLMLADFYLRAFHSGSLEVSVLSLSGLLVLLTRHGLGDPDTLSSSSSEFYAQLYSLVKPETFDLKKRARFQRLLVASLSSGLLPARFAAVFAKKCMRVAIACSEPGTIMWLLAVTYSLIQKHHSHCEYLLHQTSSAQPRPAGGDPFDVRATLSKALEQIAGTSLWELKLLLRHHIPAVATLAKLFLKPFFKKTARKLEPDIFLDQSVEKTFKQAMRAAERQAGRWKARGEKCPLAFTVEDDTLADQVVGWAAELSTTQRKVGAGL